MNMHLRPPRAAKRLVRLSLPVRANASPRAVLEAQIEFLIRLLDFTDGDTDLEPCCEDEGAQCDDEGVDTDREPSIGAPEGCRYYPSDDGQDREEEVRVASRYEATPMTASTRCYLEAAEARASARRLAEIVTRVKGRKTALQSSNLRNVSDIKGLVEVRP